MALSKSFPTKVQSRELISKRLIGKGSSSIVYETTWEGQQGYARKDFLQVPIDIFEREAAVLVALDDHPNVVRTYCWTVNEESCSLLIDLMDDDLLSMMERRKASQRKKLSSGSIGRSGAPHTTSHVINLDKFIADRKNFVTSSDSVASPLVCPLDMTEVFHIIVQIAEGMAFLHGNELVHGDLKPKNVMVKLSGNGGLGSLDQKAGFEVKVADFGLCLTKMKSRTFVSRQARNLEMVQWRAPELLDLSLLQRGHEYHESSTDSDWDSDSSDGDCIVHGDKVPTKYSDVYSFASTCSQILTGEGPYSRLGLDDLVSKILEPDGLRPQLPRSTCPAQLRDLLESCWGEEDKRPSFHFLLQHLKGLQASLRQTDFSSTSSSSGSSYFSTKETVAPLPPLHSFIHPNKRNALWVEQFCRRVSMLAVAAEGVMNVKDHPAQIILDDFATSLRDLASSLKELQKELEVHPPTNPIKSQLLRDMEAEMTAAEQLVMVHRAQARFTSLLSYPLLLLKLQSCRGNLSKDLESITPVACSPRVKSQITRTQQKLNESPPKLGLKDQNMIDSLSSIAEPGSTNLKCKELAEQVAEYFGVALSDAAFAEHLEVARKDMKEADDDEFSLLLDQRIKALEKGLAFQEEPGTGDHVPDFPSTSSSSGSSYFASKEVTTPWAPLPSFICPITKQVMKDPVRIDSGETYERTAILQWFKDGKTTSSPLGIKLKNTTVNPNFALRLSISEWRERNHSIRLDDAEWRLRSFQPVEQERGARDIKILCEEDGVNKYSVASRNTIPLLIRLADSPTTVATLRDLCFNAMAALAQDHPENQETLVFEGVIDVLVSTLRKSDEAEPAINLLRVLSGSPKIADIICRTPDAVPVLVTFLSHENESLVVSVKAVLVNLPTSDENVIRMAEANLMKPLVTRLVEGVKESKVLMARTLARLEHMSDRSLSLACTRKTIETLINMTNSEDEEEVDSAILALKNLSTSPTVGVLIADCTGLEILIRLITSEKTAAVKKAGASYIAANVLVAVGNEWKPSEDRDTEIDHLVETFFILISSSTTPPAAQSHLLQGLVGLAEGKDTRHVAKAIMISRDAFSVLIPWFEGKKPEFVRRASLKLFTSLARKNGDEAWMAIKRNSGTLRLFVEMLKTQETSEPEKVAAAMIISHLPEADRALTGALCSCDIVPILASYLTSSNQSLQEACVAALVRYTSPDSLHLQTTLARLGVIPILVTLLDSQRRRVRLSAAQALANFSKSTAHLVKPVARNKRWLAFKRAPKSCKLHPGPCTVETTFCLLVAEAIHPLLNLLAEDDSKIAEAALEALYTLVDNDQWKKGCYIIHQAGGISSILRHLPKCTPRAQEISMAMCEKFFQIPQFQNSFGPMAQMDIIRIAQQAAPSTKDVAVRILRKLDLPQSSFFSGSTAPSKR